MFLNACSAIFKVGLKDLSFVLLLSVVWKPEGFSGEGIVHVTIMRLQCSEFLP